MYNLDHHLYNLHTHTEFCDGRSTMAQMAKKALELGIKTLGFTPHAPIPISSPVNMKLDQMESYLSEARHLKELYRGQLDILTGLELDYLGGKAENFNPATLDYTISSVHFIPEPEHNEEIDVDGHPDKFCIKMNQYFDRDIRWVCESFFDRTLEMCSRGGFDIAGHLDKISRNAEAFYTGISKEIWYRNRVLEIIDCLEQRKDISIEINTKFAAETGRFFPDIYYWPTLKKTGLRTIINSDAHQDTLLNSGRQDAIKEWEKI